MIRIGFKRVAGSHPGLDFIHPAILRMDFNFNPKIYERTSVLITSYDEGASFMRPQNNTKSDFSPVENPAYKTVMASLEDAKAEEIVTIDITKKSSIGDSMIIASGRSHRHVGAIADRLTRELKDAGFGSVSVEGLPHCDWVLVDTGDVIVHIFRPEVRQFYNIEKMWSMPSNPDTPVATIS